MAILRCATCGAKVKTEADRFTAFCEYCGNEMTVFESTSEFEVDSKGVLVQYNGRGGDVVIPDNIKRIGDSAFKGNDRVLSVVFPESLVEIGARAFEGCTELESADLPDNLLTLGDHAFFKCSSLRKMSIPSGVLSIKKTTFSECRSLSSVELHDSIRTIEDYAFDECYKLTRIVLPKRLRNLGGWAFKKCTALEEIELPDSLESMGASCFSDCTNLKKVKLSGSLEALESFSFDSCASLESIHIPGSVKKIDTFCFSDCSSLRFVTFEEGTQTIASTAFSRCQAIEGELYFPDSLLTFPSFASCKVKKISVGKAIDTFSGTLYSSFPMLETMIFRTPVAQIPESMFKYLERMKELDLPDSVEEIGESAFWQCTGLERIHLPKALKRIGTYAFYGCKALKLTQFPENLEEICKEAFFECESLEECYFPASLRRIGESAFQDCLKLRKLVFEEGCEVLENSCFYNYSARDLEREAYLPSTIKSMGEDAVLGDYCYETPTYIYSPRNEVIKEYCNTRRWIYWEYRPSAAELAAQKEAEQKALRKEWEELRNQLGQLEDRLEEQEAGANTIRQRIQAKRQEIAGYQGLFDGGKRKKAEAELQDLLNSEQYCQNAYQATYNSMRQIAGKIADIRKKLQ